MKRVVALALLAGALALPTQAWAAEARAVFTEAAEGSVTLSSAGGCRTVDIPKVGKDIFGFVVYRFHHVKHWCWTYPRITSMTVYTYVSDVDPNMEYRGVIGSKSYFFTWCCRSGTSGHYSLRQASSCGASSSASSSSW